MKYNLGSLRIKQGFDFYLQEIIWYSRSISVVELEATQRYINGIFRKTDEYCPKLKACPPKSTNSKLGYAGRKCASWVSEDGATIQL